MERRINFVSFLFYFLGGLFGLIIGFILLHLLHTLEMPEWRTHSFLSHWLANYPQSHSLVIVAGAVLAGFLFSFITVQREKLNFQNAKLKNLEDISQTKTELISFAKFTLNFFDTCRKS
jgi:hypothetical protein